MSQQAAWDAIKAAVDAKFAAPRVFTAKDAVAQTSDHIILWVSRRFVDDQLASGEVTIPGSRAVLRSVCKTPNNVPVFRDRIAAAIEDVILSGGYGPFVFETQADVDSDDGWYVGADTFTF